MGEIINVASISELHKLMGFEKPRHPLISLLDTKSLHVEPEDIGNKVICDFYMISLKDKSCGVEYGRNPFDFDEGVMAFSAPGQAYTPTKPISEGEIEGWMLFFHPNLIRNTHLGEAIEKYSFFNYDVFEALHLSEGEERTITEVASNIKSEYEQRIDNHSQRVIVSNLDLLLSYCLRFYERQFNTRSTQSKDLISQFETGLKDYFNEKRALDNGLPSIEQFATEANLSQHYFSDLIKKETGRTPKDHINEYVVERAKNLLLATEHSVSEIAYELGFNYPHYFTRLFKSKTGQTPVEFRNLN